MYSDIFKTVGNNKATCEDAICKEDNIIVLSDGCGSGALPDLGAQLSAYSLKNIRGETKDEFLTAAQVELDSVYSKLDVHPIDLLSTVMHLEIEKGAANLNILGDGCWFYRTRAGNLHLFSIDYSFNAPYFVQYDMLGSAQRYADNCGAMATINDEILDQHTSIFWPDSRGFHFDISTDDLELIGIASDGLTSFYKDGEYDEIGNRVMIPAKDILEELLAFKTTGGQFLERRAKAYLKSLEGVKHYDDLSIGVVLL